MQQNEFSSIYDAGVNNSFLMVYEMIKDYDFSTLESLFEGGDQQTMETIFSDLKLDTNVNFNCDRIIELFEMIQTIVQEKVKSQNNPLSLSAHALEKISIFKTYQTHNEDIENNNKSNKYTQ